MNTEILTKNSYKILFTDQNGTKKLIIASNCEDQIQAINKVLELRQVKKLNRVEKIEKQPELKSEKDTFKSIFSIIFIFSFLLLSCKKETKAPDTEKISCYTMQVITNAATSIRYTTDLIKFTDSNITGIFIYKFFAPLKKFPDNKYQIGFSKSTIAPIQLKITMDSITVHSYFTTGHQYTISY